MPIDSDSLDQPSIVDLALDPDNGFGQVALAGAAPIRRHWLEVERGRLASLVLRLGLERYGRDSGTLPDYRRAVSA